ncbi:hypothetical protein SprV_0100431100 [Sparganum proliferum]
MSESLHHHEGSREKINIRLISPCLPLCQYKFVKVVSTRVALEMISLDDVERQLYEDKHDVLVTLPKAEKLIVPDYLSARFGTDYAACEKVLGQRKIGTCNRNELLLLLVCGEHSLLLNNTFIRLPMLD